MDFASRLNHVVVVVNNDADDDTCFKRTQYLTLQGGASIMYTHEKTDCIPLFRAVSRNLVIGLLSSVQQNKHGDYRLFI